MTQVVNNLISNAVKFSPPGEVVEVSVLPARGGVRVEVRDYGPGIPEEFHARIFQRFAQANSSDDRAIGGSGLGLAISKALVEKMGGKIGYGNERGGGARFWFELQTAKAARAGAILQPPAAFRVLACGASDPSHDLLVQLLMGVNHEIHRVFVEDQAEGAWQNGPWDLIVLSRRSGCVERAPFLQRLQGGDARTQPPIIVLPDELEPGSASLGAAMELLHIVVNALDAAHVRRAPRWAVRRGARLGRRVLHVEDDADLRRVVAGLTPTDWEMSGAGTLRAARDALATRRFDLVVLDLSLPDGWGGELLDAMDGVPVVVFSGADLRGDA